MMHMTYFEKSIENFLNQLEFDVDFYDVLSGSQLMDYTRDFISSYDIEITEGCDYRNDKNDSGRYYCDIASERADSQIDIYNSDLWEKAPKFQCRIEEAINSFWFDKSNWLTHLFQMGQYLYYSQLSWYVLDKLAEYVNA